VNPSCHCDDGWICEQHHEKPWPHDGCGGPGMLCQDPECSVGRVKRAELDATPAPALIELTTRHNSPARTPDASAPRIGTPARAPPRA
jgi:hypothetical protein